MVSLEGCPEKGPFIQIVPHSGGDRAMKTGAEFAGPGDDGMKKGVRVVKLCDTLKQIPSRKMTAEGSGLWNKITMW